MNHSQLKDRCFDSVENLMVKLGGEIFIKNGERHAFKDNGSNILGVAHLDTVQKVNFFSPTELDKEAILCPKLDDRLGVYTLMDLLPSLGINIDILFTDNEEIGRTTAKDFISEKQYNWIIEFDRCGTGYVDYQFDFKEPQEFFESHIGSFSDISKLEHLGCKGFNIGVGYVNEHSKTAYMYIDEYMQQMSRFVEFYNKYKDTFFEHSESNIVGYDRSDIGEYYDMFDFYCHTCQMYLSKDEVITDKKSGLSYCTTCTNEVEYDPYIDEFEKDWRDEKDVPTFSNNNNYPTILDS